MAWSNIKRHGLPSVRNISKYDGIIDPLALGSSTNVNMIPRVQPENWPICSRPLCRVDLRQHHRAWSMMQNLAAAISSRSLDHDLYQHIPLRPSQDSLLWRDNFSDRFLWFAAQVWQNKTAHTAARYDTNLGFVVSSSAYSTEPISYFSNK